MKKYYICKLKKLEKKFNFSLKNKMYNKNIKKIIKISKEYSKIYPIISLYKIYKKLKEDMNVAKEFLKEKDTKNFAIIEINKIKKKKLIINNKIKKKFLNLKKKKKENVFLEIRAGTGGKESSLFVSDLLKMYKKFSENNNWNTKIVSYSLSEINGYKEIILYIEGLNAYSLLKFESGCHRVQRIPITETQGRIHTSICTVAVIPEITKKNKNLINFSDIKIDTFRSSGAGGQHVNKTDSAVRITHIPTKIVVECQNNRSQHKNKSLALKILHSRIMDLEKKNKKKKESQIRKKLIGSGDRSEKIRTYNFHKNRVTDHRINLTLYKLNNILNGNLKEIIDNLIYKKL